MGDKADWTGSPKMKALTKAAAAGDDDDAAAAEAMPPAHWCGEAQ